MILKGTVGVVITFTVKRDGAALNISGASTKNLLLRAPSGVVTTKAASFTTDGTDGKLTYTTIAGDLNAIGNWLISASIVMAGWTGQTTADTLAVVDVLS